MLAPLIPPLAEINKGSFTQRNEQYTTFFFLFDELLVKWAASFLWSSTQQSKYAVNNEQTSCGVKSHCFDAARRAKAAGWNSSLVHSILALQNPVACEDCSQTKLSTAINHRINALSDPMASFGGHICILWFTRQCQPPEMLVSTGALCVARCRKQVRSVLNEGLYVGPAWPRLSVPSQKHSTSVKPSYQTCTYNYASLMQHQLKAMGLFCSWHQSTQYI